MTRTKWIIIAIVIACMLPVLTFATGLMSMPLSFSASKSESIAFVDRAVPHILSGNDDSILTSYADPELLSLLENFHQQKNSQLIPTITGVFGELSSMSPAKTKDQKTGFALPYGFISSVILSYDATFKNALAVIEIGAVKRGRTWSIQEFYVSAPKNAKYKDWGDL